MSNQESASVEKEEASSCEKGSAFLLLVCIALIVTNILTYTTLNARIDELEMAPGAAVTSAPMVDQEKLKDFKVFNAHDHLFLIKHFNNYDKAAKRTGIAKTLFVGSSSFTIYGKKGKKDEMNDENSEEILKLARKYPKKVVPFCTIYPGDPKKLEKLKKFAEKGAKGVKLYSGHSNFYEKERPLDAPEMLPVYAWCEENSFPICWHVRYDAFADEFLRVMGMYPKLKVIVPHFGVAFYRPNSKYWKLMETILDKYPNVYVDTSFGTRSILVHGLEIVSDNRKLFREFFDKYQDKIVFGTDMVVTGNKEKTPEWIEAVIRACRNVLEKDDYFFYMAATGSPYALKKAKNKYGRLRGLALSDDILKKVYETNIERILSAAEQGDS
ncbi:amidohydrolase family protein [Candidatus Hydrogenedentota bacterium]